ncbi:MAG: class I SAM-dependent methyltransferase [Luteolibacter sp.]|uniref:O-methyltransferase n=1 Tax=Luteolibacter sp. TaxID=1962973 RepID=UPI003264F118
MEGQLNTKEREIITRWVTELKPEHVIEVGTWLGGGSTLHILKALHANGRGHLWGIEAFQSIYDAMLKNINTAGEEIAARFTPLFGFSQNVIPEFLAKDGGKMSVDLVFLDGGDNPMEQITEFQLLRDAMPVGAILLSHDAKLRKGKWLVPYLRAHDNWECRLHDVSDEGMFEARKTSAQPSESSRKVATKTLASLRMQPTELLGRLLPAPVISVLLKMIPRKLVLKITQGRG